MGSQVEKLLLDLAMKSRLAQPIMDWTVPYINAIILEASSDSDNEHVIVRYKHSINTYKAKEKGDDPPSIHIPVSSKSLEAEKSHLNKLI